MPEFSKRIPPPFPPVDSELETSSDWRVSEPEMSAKKAPPAPAFWPLIKVPYPMR